MPFDPFAFLKLVTALRSNPSASEAHFRTAVGRAYYGTFLLAREQAGIRVTSGAEHDIVAQYVEGIDVTAGNQLKQLRLLRKRADYDLSNPVSLAVTSAACSHAVFVLKALGLAHTF